MVALRRIGFHQVLDTTFAADMTVVEEANELMQRLDGKDSSKPALPQFTSCCPAWVSFAETFYPAQSSESAKKIAISRAAEDGPSEA